MKSKTGLYTIFLRRLKETQSLTRKEIISFPIIFEKLCRNFSITKAECWEILFVLRDFGLIEVVPFHGVKIKDEN